MTESLNNLLDDLYSAIVPNQEELEFGDPSYAQEIGMTFEKFKASLIDYIENNYISNVQHAAEMSVLDQEIASLKAELNTILEAPNHELNNKEEV